MEPGTGKYEFDLKYQERLLAAMICDKRFMEKNFDVLQPSYFDDEVLSGIAEASRNFFLRERSVADVPALCEEVRSSVAPGRKRSEYVDRVKQVLSKGIQNSGYYQKTAIEFARKQSMYLALREADEHLGQGNFDQIVESVQKAFTVGADMDDTSYDYFNSVRARAKAYVTERKTSTSRVTTGFPSLDAITDGGLDSGELGLIAAPPGHGKTTTLVNIGAAALLAGKTVLHVTLELSRKMIALKYDQRFFGADLNTIRKKPRSFRRAIVAIRKNLKGRLVIAEFPTRSLSLTKLRSVASSITGLGLIVVDFADLMKPVRPREELRHELTELYTNLRGLGGELRVPIWTASQANSLALGSRIITMKNLAECFNKAGIVDLGVSVNRTDRETSENKLRLYVLKSRIGQSDVEISCTVDWKKCRIEEVETSGTDDEDLDE